jgi:signal transduction histidine kinase
LQLKNRHLENSVEELNSFNYIASHDLKEPLRKILFFTDILQGKEKELSPESRQYLTKIQASGVRMKNLLTDLLTYSQASMMEHKKEWIDLNVLLGTVVESLAEMLKEKRAIVDYKGLPRVLAVGSQMEQLFENLITNSVKYSKEKEPPLIFISSAFMSKEGLPASFEAVHDKYHQILFSDNGIGFTQDNAEKVFELFQRLHGRQEFSGTGIGLTICRKIVQNHDGFIAATSEVNKGTTFTIYLPA